MKVVTYDIKLTVKIGMPEDDDPKDAFTELDYEFYPDLGQIIVDTDMYDYTITKTEKK